MRDIDRTLAAALNRRRLTDWGMGGALLAATGMMSGTHRAAAQATPEPDPPESGPRRHRRRRPHRKPDAADLPYVADGHPLQTLDLYLPPEPGSAPIPLVMWIHGGGWVGGDKRSVGVPYLLRDGYTIASINYRLMPDDPFPAQIQDANAALSFLWQRADEYVFDRDRFVVGGSSAGASSALLVGLAANDAVEEFDTNPDVQIAALLDFFGTSNADSALEEGRLDQLESEEQIAEFVDLANARGYVDAEDPPVLIVHGEEDMVVPIEQSDDLVAVLEEAGVAYAFERVPGVGHGMRHYRTQEMADVVRSFLASALGGS